MIVFGHDATAIRHHTGQSGDCGGDQGEEMKIQTCLKYMGAVLFIVLSLAFFFLIYLLTLHMRRPNDPLIAPIWHGYIYWKIAQGIFSGILGFSLFASGRKDEKNSN